MHFSKIWLWMNIWMFSDSTTIFIKREYDVFDRFWRTHLVNCTFYDVIFEQKFNSTFFFKTARWAPIGARRRPRYIYSSMQGTFFFGGRFFVFDHNFWFRCRMMMILLSVYYVTPENILNTYNIIVWHLENFLQTHKVVDLLKKRKFYQKLSHFGCHFHFWKRNLDYECKQKKNNTKLTFAPE